MLENMIGYRKSAYHATTGGHGLTFRLAEALTDFRFFSRILLGSSPLFVGTFFTEAGAPFRVGFSWRAAMNNTIISLKDFTWNVWSGCSKVSPGCAHCYAETLSENKRGTRAFPVGFELTYRWHKLLEPLKVK